MVAKINIGNNLYGALAYNQEKVDEGLGTVLGSNLFFEQWMDSSMFQSV